MVCRGRHTGEESCRPKMRSGGAIEGSHRPWGALRRSFATLASANRAEIAPRTGTVGKVTSLPFSSFNPDLKRGTHCRKKSRNRRRLPCCQIDNVGAELRMASPAAACWWTASSLSDRRASSSERPPTTSHRSSTSIGVGLVIASHAAVSGKVTGPIITVTVFSTRPCPSDDAPAR